MHVNGESHFYSNTTSGFNARCASQKFPADNVLAENNRPALKPGHSTVAAQCWHFGICTADHAGESWPAPFWMEQPTQFLLIAVAHAYYEKTLFIR